MSKYDDLLLKLKEIFQIDRPELDFGIYRILNSRSAEINTYLERGLKDKVTAILAVTEAANLEELIREMKEKESQYRKDGIDPDQVPKLKELRDRVTAFGRGRAERENAVFTHLLTFFSRYYDKGDFISQRRYKGDTYAIPYAGEEVILHWANKDQYYTKSGENFANYSFLLDDGRKVHFRLIAADTAKDNRKDNDKERRFVLIDRTVRTLIDAEGEEYEQEFLPLEEIDHELVIRFDYRAMPKGTKQEALVTRAVETILAHSMVKSRWLDLGRRMPTEKNPHRTLLEKCLTAYTTKNTADYFIHKDLGGFLRRELDFYIKTEVMHLDDVQNAAAFADIEKNLRMIQCLRSIALELIGFLAQLEDFQKKLWLKKKFVVSSHYCITLDRVPESLYPEIVANERQWAQWKQLGVWEGDGPGTIKDLKNGPYRMVDTSLYGMKLKNLLINNLDDIDRNQDGLLVHADNFQGINFLSASKSNQLTGIYIDPPYNTDASPIIYKNGYQHSSWASLVLDRMTASLKLLDPKGLVCVAIDDFEYPYLLSIMNGNLGLNHTGTAVVRSKPQGRPTTTGFSANHDYAVFWSNDEKPTIGRLPRKGSKAERYPYSDEKGIYAWANFRKAGTDSNRGDRKKSFYPVYVLKDNIRIPKMTWCEDDEIWLIDEQLASDEVAIWPIDSDGKEKVWTCSIVRLKIELDDLKVVRGTDGRIEIQKKYRPNQEGALPGTWWDQPEYSASESGTKVLKNLFKTKDFDFTKSINLVADNLRVLNIRTGATVLDYFAGSGTTACATLALDRQDGGARKYILIEQAEYFDTVLIPRIQKNVFSVDWANGKPIAPESGISHCFKVLKLESYEDTLNNLQLSRTSAQSDLLAGLHQEARDDYLLHYMLDVESRGSLLSVDDFKKPFDYRLNIALDSAGAYETRNIDLVETFNYLIGLRVKHYDAQTERGFVTVSGTLPSGESCLVLWRDAEVLDYEGLSKLCDKLAINPADNEFDVVYINGDHNIPTVFTSTEAEGGFTKTMKLRQIEPEFLNRMFSMDE